MVIVGVAKISSRASACYVSDSSIGQIFMGYLVRNGPGWETGNIFLFKKRGLNSKPYLTKKKPYNIYVFFVQIIIFMLFHIGFVLLLFFL